MKVNIGPYNDDEIEDFERKIEVQVDDYDVWGLDHTLALIILPCLKKLREKQQGSPTVDLEDVPENLRSKNNESDDYPSVHDRWSFVLDSMIWSFEQIIDPKDDQFNTWDEDKEPLEFGEPDEKGRCKLVVNCETDRVGLKNYNGKIQTGLNLFGKYYRGLWD